MQSLTVREATAADYTSVCRLLAEGDEFHRRRVPHIFQEPQGPVRECDYFLSQLHDDNSGLFLAEVEGHPVGFIHVLIRESPPIPIMVRRRFAVIDSLVVSEPFRRAGVGRLLMEQGHAWVWTRGIDTVELNVWEFNLGAIALYEDLGYVTDRRHMTIQLSDRSHRR
jgi:diamine N-acetyltransferase